ncbi:hypothetical protein FQZ97_1092710 [compost metagenome]
MRGGNRCGKLLELVLRGAGLHREGRPHVGFKVRIAQFLHRRDIRQQLVARPAGNREHAELLGLFHGGDAGDVVEGDVQPVADQVRHHGRSALVRHGRGLDTRYLRQPLAYQAIAFGIIADRDRVARGLVAGHHIRNAVVG